MKTMNKNIILYSTGCPRCEILKRKLDEKRIGYETVTDIEKMLSLGIYTVPYLSVDGNLLDFRDAIRWVDSTEGGK